MLSRNINAPDAAQPAGPYSQAVEVTGGTRTLYISGQVGVALDGSVPADIAAQTELAWTNLIAQLRAAGMDVGNLETAPGSVVRMRLRIAPMIPVDDPGRRRMRYRPPRAATMDFELPDGCP